MNTVKKSNEKIELISALMESYRESNLNTGEKWLVDRFDSLYEMDVEALKYLAQLRKVPKRQSRVLME